MATVFSGRGGQLLSHACNMHRLYCVCRPQIDHGHAVVRVNETALPCDTGTRLLGPWLANSGRQEGNAPEFERFASISEAGVPIGPVKMWIPLEPLTSDGLGQRMLVKCLSVEKKIEFSGRASLERKYPKSNNQTKRIATLNIPWPHGRNTLNDARD